MHARLQSHFKIALRILRYLKGSPGKGVLISKSDYMNLSACVDVDRGKCLVSIKYVICFSCFLLLSMIFWKSKKQVTISRSSTKSKYRAIASTTCEILWILNILKDLNVKNLLLVNLHCDNRYPIQIEANPVFRERTKHFETVLHLVREKCAGGVIKIETINSENQIANKGSWYKST